MKNLLYHKKQIAQHRARNAFNAALGQALDAISETIMSASNERWDNMISELHRCNPTLVTFIIVESGKTATVCPYCYLYHNPVMTKC